MKFPRVWGDNEGTHKACPYGGTARWKEMSTALEEGAKIMDSLGAGVLASFSGANVRFDMAGRLDFIHCTRSQALEPFLGTESASEPRDVGEVFSRDLRDFL